MHQTVTVLVLASETRARVLSVAGEVEAAVEVDNLDRAVLESRRDRYAAGDGEMIEGNGSRRPFEGMAEAEARLRRLFVEDVVAALRDRLESDPFDRLVLVAEPGLLQLMRAALSPELRRRLVFDLDRELIDLHPAEIPARIGRLATI